MQQGFVIRSLGYKEVSLSACCIHEDRPKEPLDVTEILREGIFGISSSIEIFQATPLTLYL